MQNFIGPLAGEAKEHAETHAINGTDPLTPEMIGAATMPEVNQAIASQMQGVALSTHTHTASAITGTLAIANGGTGANNATTARNNLGIYIENLDINHKNLSKKIFGGDQFGEPYTWISRSDHNHDIYALNDHTHALADLYYENPTLGPGWSPYGGVYTFKAIKYEKIILLSGLVVRTTTSGNLICTLPAFYRPSTTRVFMTWMYYNSTYYPARVDIASSGAVSLVYPVPSVAIGWISLDGMCFMIS